MPDTHFAMPRTPSAPYAELLEAEAPETMTTSDAPPNGSAAAAAAFARLLASGDQAMQPETFTSIGGPALIPQAPDNAHRPHDLRATLLGSTTLPALGMTIAEASQKTAELLDQHRAAGGLTDEEATAITGQWAKLEDAVIAATPGTILDAAAILDRTFPDPNSPTWDVDQPAVRRVASFLRQVAEAAQAAHPMETEDPAMAAYLDWVAAANEANRAAEEVSNLPEGSPKWEAANEACYNAEELSNDLMEAVVNSIATSPAGVLAKFAYFAWITSSAMTHEDIKLWSGMIADIARLGVFPLESKEVAPFGEGCRFSPIHRAAMAKEGIDPSGRAIALPSSLWEPVPERSGVMYDPPVSLAERIGGGAQLAPDRQDADASIFAAFGRWVQSVRDCYAAKADEDSEHLSEMADEAALDVTTHEPATREGLAAQVFTMLHLEHGGTVADALDVDFSSMCGLDDSAHVRAVHALVDRVRRLSRRDGEEAGQDALTSLYARWADARTRYLADGLSDEESDALEDELDRIEDRLESEPVRCMADAVAKLGYFLTTSNRILDDGCLPYIDSNGTTAWQRILFVVEDGAERLPTDVRESFRAMVAGLRQLMQRHVKLEEAADCRSGAYQLPDEVSQAMHAACARNVAESAAEDVREPDRAQGQRDEALGLFRALKSDNRKNFLSFMRFMPVSDHLHGAMLGFAREHGMTRHYHAWLEGCLADIPAEQGGANDQHQDADAFANTVATFEAEAPATLALPLEPTGRMVDAGASAAGITPAQFQAAYAAAVEALKLERAA